MDINLGLTASIVTQLEQTISVSTLKVKKMVDLPEEKRVFVLLKEIGDQIVLWEGDDYDAIGQWTDSDVENRLLEIFNI